MDPNSPSGFQSSTQSTALQLEAFYKKHATQEIAAYQAKWKEQEEALQKEIQHLHTSGAPQ